MLLGFGDSLEIVVGLIAVCWHHFLLFVLALLLNGVVALSLYLSGVVVIILKLM